MVCEEPREINGCFGLPKDDGTNQILILDARRKHSHFIKSDYPELPRLGLFMQLEKYGKKDIFVSKLYIDSFYHRL